MQGLFVWTFNSARDERIHLRPAWEPACLFGIDGLVAARKVFLFPFTSPANGTLSCLNDAQAWVLLREKEPIFPIAIKNTVSYD